LVERALRNTTFGHIGAGLIWRDHVFWSEAKQCERLGVAKRRRPLSLSAGAGIRKAGSVTVGAVLGGTGLRIGRGLSMVKDISGKVFALRGKIRIISIANTIIQTRGSQGNDNHGRLQFNWEVTMDINEIV
jgi:hypothetical protein